MTDSTGREENRGGTAARVARNTLWLTAARLGGKVLALPLVIILARYLGPKEFGHWALITSLVVILSTVADGGFQVLTIRDLSPSPGKSWDYFKKSLSVRMILTLLAGIFLVVWGVTVEAERAPLWMFGLGVILLVDDGLIRAGQAVLSARERMGATSIVSLAQALGATLLIGALLLVGGGLFSAVSGLALVNLGAAALILWLCRPFLFRESTEELSAWRLLAKAFPYGLLTILTIIYFRIDVVMLSAMRGSQEAGLYNAALRLFDAGLIIPTALAGALFPVMSRQLARRENQGLIVSHSRAIHLLALVGLPAAVGGWVYADWLTGLFYGPDYGPAGPVLALLSLGWVLFFINIPLGNLLAASEMMSKFIPFAAANTGLNVVMNFVLIPGHGAVGAVIATLVCEVSGLIIQFGFAWKILAARPPLFGLLIRPALAATGLFLFWNWSWSLSLSPWMSLVLGGALYLVLLLLFRAVSAEDRAFIKRTLLRMRDPEPA